VINIIKRAPNDDFTFELFKDLLESVDHKFEAHYIWSNPPKRLKRILETTEFTQPNVVIGIKDMLDQWEVYNVWEHRAQAGVRLIDTVAAKNPDKNFIIFTSLENIQSEEVLSPNVQFVCWGGDITNQAAVYPDVEPVLDKNFYSERPYICLNRNAREHRVVTLSYLFGRGYENSGEISFLGDRMGNNKSTNLHDNLSWDFESIQADFFVDNRVVMQEGFVKFCEASDLDRDDYDIYEEENDNVTNFDLNLRDKYLHSFVEIVSESSFVPPAYNVTEKTLNSIYGCNFPILLGGVGIVQLMRDIGFDMFDDIVDHSYDTITNPFNRIINAVECNKQLLLDHARTKKLWQGNQSRFESNIKIAQTQLYPWYKQRATAQFRQLKWL